MTRPGRPARGRGFTLVEVLVALVIVGVALAAALRASAALVANGAALELKLYAAWSAENRLVEARLAGTQPAFGQREFACPQGKAQLVCVETVKTTANASFRRIEVTVYSNAARDAKLLTLATAVGNVR